MQQYSLEHTSYLKGIRRRKAIKITLQLAILFSFFAVWEIAAQLEWINPFIFSSPSRCIGMIATLWQNDLLYHIGITLSETMAGFLIGSIAGFLIAVVLWWSPMAQSVLDPYLVVLNSLPKIALGPVIIVWVGAGTTAIITVTLLISIVVATIGILNGFLEVEEEKQLLLRTFGANKRQVFMHVVVPASLPTTVSVLKLNIGMAWVGVIVGEFLISKAGIGHLIVYGQQIFKMDIVMSGTLILCVLSAGMYFMVAYAEKLVNRSRSR